MVQSGSSWITDRRIQTEDACERVLKIQIVPLSAGKLSLIRCETGWCCLQKRECASQSFLEQLEKPGTWGAHFQACLTSTNRNRTKLEYYLGSPKQAWPYFKHRFWWLGHCCFHWQQHWASGGGALVSIQKILQLVAKACGKHASFFTLLCRE